VITNYLFRGNSTYDPDQSGGGVQPKYYDAISAAYNRVEVVKSVIEIIVSTPDGSDDVYEIALCPSGTQTISYDEILSAEYGQGGFVSQQTPFLRLVAFGDTKALTGYSNGDTSVVSSVNAVPTVGWNFIIGGQSQTGNSGTLRCLVKIKYSCIFSRQSEDDS